MTVATNEEYKAAAEQQSTRKIDFCRLRGNIYDCNGEPLTSRRLELNTAVFPGESAFTPLSQMLSGEELEAALERIKRGEVVKVKGKSPTAEGCWVNFFEPIRYDGRMPHVLGYIGADGHGVTGIEKGFDDILYSESFISARYRTNSLKQMMEGDGIELLQGVASGKVTLTVDIKLQSVLEQAMADVTSGAAVITEAATGKIKAIVSCPDFDQNDISSALNDEKSPLINRAVYSYNVGSVFKPCLAAAALETGNGNYRYTCTGSIRVGNKTFKCHKASGHGEIGLKEAVSESCNTYFYTLAEVLGAENIYKTASGFRFGTSLDLGGGIVSSSGSIPSLEQLTASPLELTNLSIGQGELMLSPVALSVMYSAIVNNGEYRMPYIVQSTEKNGVEKRNTPSEPTVVFSSNTAEILKEYLINTVQNGTGNAAYSENVLTGGKTGTAQTGWREGNRSILNGWFCGFYEGQRDYVIVIVKEDVKSGSTDCAPIFKTVTERMQRMGF